MPQRSPHVESNALLKLASQFTFRSYLMIPRGVMAFLEQKNNSIDTIREAFHSVDNRVQSILNEYLVYDQLVA